MGGGICQVEQQDDDTKWELCTDLFPCTLTEAPNKVITGVRDKPFLSIIMNSRDLLK